MQYHCDEAGIYLVGLSAALVFLLLYGVLTENYGRRWLFGAFVLLFCFSLGSLSFHQTWQSLVWQPSPGNTYTGVVEEYPLEKKKTVFCSLRLLSGQKMVAYIATDSASLLLSPGKVVSFTCEANPLEKRNEGEGFNYDLYLKKKGYAATGYVSKNSWKVVGNQFGFKYKALECQKYLAEKLKTTGFNEKAYSFGATMLLGCRDLMDEEVNKNFAVSGISHVISISGLHAQILFVMLFFLFGFLGNSRKSRIVRQVIVLLCMWVFTFISGLSAPVVRASLMLTFYALADTMERPTSSLNIILASAFLMLFYNPLYLFDVSFQLTYIAMLAIVVIYPRLEGLHTTKNPIVRYVWSSFCISLAAQIATVPLCLYYFQQFPVYFWLANVVIAPLVGPALIGMVVALVLQSFFSFPEWLYRPIEWCLDAIILTADAIERLPFSVVKGLAIDGWQLVFMYGVLLSIIALFSLKKKIFLYVFLSFVLLEGFYYL